MDTSDDGEDMTATAKSWIDAIVADLTPVCHTITELWEQGAYHELREYIDKLMWGFAFHPNWDEKTGYDMCLAWAVLILLTKDERDQAYAKIIDIWRELKVLVAGSETEENYLLLDSDVYKTILTDIVNLCIKIGDEQEEFEASIAREHFIPSADRNLEGYGNIQTIMRLGFYIKHIAPKSFETSVDGAEEEK